MPLIRRFDNRPSAAAPAAPAPDPQAREARETAAPSERPPVDQTPEPASEATSKTKPARTVRRDHYQDMTDRIVHAIEDGVVPWRPEWDRVPVWPSNGISERPYHGVNIPILLGRTFQDGRWATFKQAKKQGWHVKRGEKASPIYFHTMIEVAGDPDPETGEAETKKIPVLKRFSVFNFSQIDGAPPLEHAEGRQEMTDLAAERIEDMMAAMGVEVVHGFRTPAFHPAEDRICLPDKDSFDSDSAYYATKLHELVHWTGHPDRMNRGFARDRESSEYAREELRAELGSAMLCARLGVPYRLENHAGYLDGYLALLKKDKREIYRASRDAERIVTHILAHHPAYRDDIRNEAMAMAEDARAAGLDMAFDAAEFDYDDEMVLDIESTLADCGIG